MANSFVDLPAPAANGAGDWVDTSAFGSVKTITVSGLGSGPAANCAVTIEFSNESSPTTGAALRTFQVGSTGTFTLACRWMRAVVSNYKGGTPMGAVGGQVDGSFFTELDVPTGDGSGTPTDTSGYPLVKTVQVAGSFRGSVNIEISEDGGASWAQAMSFSSPGYQSVPLEVEDFVRVTRSGTPQFNPGQPVVWFGATYPPSGVSGGGGGGQSLVINVKDYGAVGNGTNNDTSAINTAMAAAQAARKPLYFPFGTYKVTNHGNYAGTLYCILCDVINGFTIEGDNATIRFSSLTDNGIVFASGCENIVVKGITFQGDNDDTFSNFGAGIYGHDTNSDFTIQNCGFSQCLAVFFSSDGSAPGRVIVTDCRILNTTEGLSLPYRSIISNNIFDSDGQPGTRSHYIYIFGPAGDTVISDNVFRRSDNKSGTYAIQFRAGGARYDYKHGLVVTGNTFVECAGSMWIGSDDATEVANATISDNTFFNCGSSVYAIALRNPVIANNSSEYDWEFVPSGGAAYQFDYVSGTSNGEAGKIVNNTAENRQPFYATVDFTGIPTAGDHIVVGPVQYTWVAAPAVAGDIAIGGTPTICAGNFAAALRSDAHNTINPVLRTPQDAMDNPFSYDGSLTTRVIVASYATFALTTTSGAITVGAVVDHRAILNAGCVVNRAQWPFISGNVFEDLPIGLSVTGCMAPVIDHNYGIGSAFQGFGNVLSTWCNNVFQLTPAREASYPRPDRWLAMTDGFPTLYNNGLAEIVPQQYGDVGGGVNGTVAVGDGKAKVWLYYGVEDLAGGAGQSSTLAWRWADGDQVKLFNGVATTYTATFQRASPGANQFNTATGLRDWINANTGGTFTAAFTAYTDTGGDANPNLMIEIKHAAAGAAGNACTVQVTRNPTTSGADLKSVRMCGVILLDRTQGHDETNTCLFMGGSDTTVKTAVFCPIASVNRGVVVSGVDAASFALAPRVYAADVTPGVGYVITNGAPGGGEVFFASPTR